MQLTPKLKTFYDKSLESVQRGHFDYALEMLKTVIHEAPFFAPAYDLLVKAALEQQKKAKTGLGEMLMRMILSQFFWLCAQYARLTDQPGKAQLFILRGIVEKPRHRGLLNTWLNLAVKQKWLDIAIVPAEALTRECPARASLYLRLAKLYIEKGEIAKAKQTIQRGLKNNPLDPLLSRRFKEIEAEKTIEEGNWG